MKKIIFLTIIVLLISTIALAGEKISVKYIKTSDGDTARFEVNGEDIRVRFLGINTPEVAGEDKVEEPYGNEAMAYTKEKLDNATNIEIEYDDNADKEDRFGRILAYVWVDGELFQEELVRKGYAKTYMMRANYKYADELKSAERQAKAEKLGVWSEEIINRQEEIKNNIDGNNSEESANENEVILYENDGINISPFVIILLALIALGIFFAKNKK